MRLLVACPRCRRQFDASGRSAGSSLRCTCGGEMTIPAPVAVEAAAVVRCSSCGAPRAGGEAACRFCASEFTLRERDLDTLCPGCMARVSGRSRFCHRCATPLLHGQAAAPTGQACPACGEEKPLSSRPLAGAGVAVAECAVCGGLWVEREVFEMLAARAHSMRGEGLSDLPPANGAGPAAGSSRSAGGASAALRPNAPLYRPCPACRTLMNRRNWGQKSGVIVDTCHPHGTWFDLDELERLLGWIREGGDERAGRLVQEEARTAERQAKLFPAAPRKSGPGAWREEVWGAELLLDFLSVLFDSLPWLRH